MATNRTAWASIDLGGEQVLQEVEVVWHLQHPRRYEVQTSLDGVTWVSRAVQVNACNPCAQAATLCDRGCSRTHPGCNPTRAVQVIGAEDDATELLTVRSPLSPSASPLSPSASWPGVTARHVRIWMISPAAALRDAPTSLGYSILEVRACAHPAVQPGVPTGRCAAAAEAKGLHVFHFEVCTCTLSTACACALHTHCRCMCMCMHTAGACA